MSNKFDSRSDRQSYCERGSEPIDSACCDGEPAHNDTASVLSESVESDEFAQSPDTTESRENPFEGYFSTPSPA